MNPTWLGIKAIIAEDHELYQEGLTLLLSEVLQDVKIYKASDYPKARALLDRHVDIDLVLLDLKLPGTDELNGLKDIRQCFPTLTIVVISTLDFKVGIRNIMQLGANGFIAKSTPIKEMKEAIERILNGELVVKTESGGEEPIVLSQRQIETLKLIAQGLTNKQIAEKMAISTATAKEHVSKVFDRLGVANRTEAVLKAQQQGLLISY